MIQTDSVDNNAVNDSRTVLRDLAIALGVLALIFIAIFGWVASLREKPQFITSYTNPTVPDLPEPEPSPEPESEPEEMVRYVVTKHTVVGDESFSLITGIYWDDIFLWPELYVHNDMKSGDPDLIYPDEIVKIYNRLGDGDEYTDEETRMILDAYIQVYDRFKSLGPHKDGSAWTLLWCGAKYRHDFLDLYSHRIDPEDLAMAKRYIAEEGYLD